MSLYEKRAAAFRGIYKESATPAQLQRVAGVQAGPLRPPPFSVHESSWAVRGGKYVDMYLEEAGRSVGMNGTSRYWAAKVQPTLFEVVPTTESSALGLLLTVLPKPLAEAVDTSLQASHPEVISALQEQWTVAGPRLGGFMRRNPNQASIIAFLIREFGARAAAAYEAGPNPPAGGEGAYTNEEYDTPTEDEEEEEEEDEQGAWFTF